ncbi:tRNA (adenosine(37)-N6)-threonylcarbamoyltransferase complex ATPase subunit type 1 TsaE [Moraxella cuniculi]|uniref:tRNA threonylcarbamoyladenosine biosynthesis protein TsaE n=1 Tax=Moraxella cuniculi TaxID=34061 RepID=A0A3S4T061_9GAMM|nr:tRNA (adenosine(37)-N6)-threonylcarbamoyltransferase complex ATPase subunit type 1 TsaE [Moraxella cuniculi]VEG13770.1 ADP-binding protein [Moraxella cuniculi]
MSLITSQMILATEADTQILAKKLAALNLTGSVWLSGDLGAGKTTLTRYWLQAMGHNGAVKSPTYTLVEPYQLTKNGVIKPIYHADFYRLNDPEELDFIGFFEYFSEENALLIIEWASRADAVLPPPDYQIKLTRRDDDSRYVELVGLELA